MQRNNPEKKEDPTEDASKGKWIKRGDFSRTFNSGGDLRKSVEYVNDKQAAKIFIGEYGDNNIKMHFSSKTNKILLNQLRGKCKELELIDNDDFMDETLGHVTLHSTTDKKAQATFLNTIDEFVPLGKSIKKEIFNTLELKQISNPEEFFAELKDLINASKFDDALQKAQSVDDDHILWVLGQYCESTQKLEQAISCYQSISKENPHYKEANFQAAHIVIRLTPNKEEHDKSSLDMDDIEIEEKNDKSSVLSGQERKNIELQISFMLKTEDPDNQNVIDQLYHQLSGGRDLQPTVKEIKCDEKTLISLASQTCLLRNENYSIQEKNQALQSEIALLKAQLAQANKTSAAAHPQSLFGTSSTPSTSTTEDTNKIKPS